MKIAHVTTVHPAQDIRIFHKECVSLAAAGHQVMLLVAGSEHSVTSVKGVEIRTVAVPHSSRSGRILKAPRALAKEVIAWQPGVVHFHDPEFLLMVNRLKRLGFRLVYDVHEDLPRQLMSKGWIPSPFRKGLSRLVEWYENRQAGKVDHVITATPHIASRFMRVNPRTTDVRNYPMPEEFTHLKPVASTSPGFCYVGGISRIRGVFEMMQAAANCKVELVLAGPLDQDITTEQLQQTPGYSNTVFKGVVGRDEVAKVLEQSLAGLALLHPTPNYMEALPTKIFEYMLAGIPVIASDFPVIRNIVEKHACGLCVDPLQVEEISHAINRLTEDPEMARSMGEKGREAAIKHYNWNIEKQKLINIYRNL